MRWHLPTGEVFPVSHEYFQVPPKLHHLVCKNCHMDIRKPVPMIAKLVDQAKPWLVQFTCDVCDESFYWCRVCKPQYCYNKVTHWSKMRHAADHGRRKLHLNRMVELGLSAVPDVEEDDDLPMYDHEVVPDGDMEERNQNVTVLDSSRKPISVPP